MANKKISDLTSGTPATTSVIPVSDAAGTVTNKITVQSIFDLDARWNVFKPGTPSLVSVTAGNAQVVVQYAPDTIITLLSQTPITDYSVQYSTNSGSTWTTFSRAATTDLTATVTGLTNGTAYLFRVAAVNGIGTSGYATSSAVTPATVPGAPTSVTASAGSAQASLSWTAPSTGGSAITDYIVEFSSDSGVNWSTFSDGTSTAASATVTGLTNGTAYIFRVSAVNAVGTGSVSSSSSAVTPSSGTAPLAPTSLSANAGSAQLALSWTAPSSNGGSAITGYSVQYTPAGGSATTVSTGGTSTSYTLTGLTNGTAYTVAVAAVNAIGTSSYSSTASGTPVGVPGAPTGVSGTSGDSQVALTWTAPSSTGGSAITGYVVEYTPAGGSAATVNTGSTTTSYTKTGLTNGTAYTFRVAAINAVGTGSYSSASGSVTPSGTPALAVTKTAGGTWTGAGTSGSPYACTANIDQTAISSGANRLTFTASQKGVFYFRTDYKDPADDNGSILRVYKNGVQLSNVGYNGNTTVTFNYVVTYGDAITFSIDNDLRFSTVYFANTQVYLDAYPIIGTPTGLTVTAGNGQAALSWTAPSANVSLLTDYTIEYSWDNGTIWRTWAHTASTTASATVTGLWNGVGYLFRVKAIGTTGQDSGYATSSTATPTGAANASIIGTYVITNYSSGAWSGTGPVTSSSTLGPVNNSTLPFLIAATASTDVTLAYRHQNATEDDNHGKQTVYYRINGSNLELTQSNPGASADTSVKLRLNAGDILALYVTGSAAYNAPTDTYTNISITAAAATSSKMVAISLANFGTWSGTGAAADKFASTAFTRNVSGGSGPIFYAISDCTVYMSATLGTIADDNNQRLGLYRANTTTGAVFINEGNTATVSATFLRGQYIWLASEGMSVSNLQVWAT